jgi:hypothetical protein
MSFTGQSFVLGNNGGPANTGSLVDQDDPAIARIGALARKGNSATAQVIEGIIASVPTGATVATTVFVVAHNAGGVSGGAVNVSTVNANTVYDQNTKHSLERAFGQPTTEVPEITVTDTIGYAGTSRRGAF